MPKGLSALSRPPIAVSHLRLNLSLAAGRLRNEHVVTSAHPSCPGKGSIVDEVVPILVQTDGLGTRLCSDIEPCPATVASGEVRCEESGTVERLVDVSHEVEDPRDSDTV